MGTVERFDVGGLEPPEFLDNGWARIDARITRVGVFPYRNPDGTVRRELRPADEVFHADSLRSLNSKPFTNDHPPKMLDGKTARKHMIGHVENNARADSDHVRASLFVMDEAALADMKNRKLQLSAGYSCDLKWTPGEFNGEKYDAIQTNIRYNHVALVQFGRAGASAVARMDSEDAVMVTDSEDPQTPAKGIQMKSITINGVKFDVSDTMSEITAQAVTNEFARLDAAVKAAEGKADAERARADSADTARTKAEKDRADASDPKTIHAAGRARAKLLTICEKVIARTDAEKDKADRFDDKTDRELRCDAVFALEGDRIDGKESDDYVRARFDSAVRNATKNASAGVLAAGEIALRADANCEDPEVMAMKKLKEDNLKRGR